MRRFFAAGFLFLGTMVAAQTAEEVDALFEDAPADVTADTTVKPDVARLLTYPLKVSGKLDSSVGVATDGHDASGFYTMEVDGIFDSRPTKELRVYGDLYTELSGGSFTSAVVSELFVDYTVADTVVIRAGKQDLSWGQGRILTPTDLVSESDSSATLKVFVPVLGQGLTVLALGNKGYFLVDDNPSWSEFVYAGQVSGDLGPLGWGVAGRVRPGLDLLATDRAATAFVKTVLWGVDLFVEGMVTATKPHYLAGFYWEKGVDPKVKLWAEASDTHWGAAGKLTWAKVTPQILWEHSRVDRSGQVLSGIEVAALPDVTVGLGLPWIYGDEGTEYVLNNEDPAKRRWAVGMKITLKAGF